MLRRALLAGLAAGLTVAAAASGAGAVELYLEHRVAGAGERITAAAFSPDGGTVAYGTAGGELFLVDAASGSAERLAARLPQEVTAIAFAPQGDFVAAAAKGKGVWLLDLGGGPGAPARTAGGGMSELKGAKDRVAVLVFRGDGKLLAAGAGKRVLVWEVPSGQVRARLEGHDGDILAIAFDQREQRILTAGRDGRMIFWDAASLGQLRQLDLQARTVPGAGVDVTAASFSADGLFVAVATSEHKLQKGGRSMLFSYHLAFFDIAKGILLRTLEDNNREIERIALWPGNCLVAFDNSTLQEHMVALRDIESGDVALSYALQSACAHLQFSADGRRLAGVVAAEGARGSDLAIWGVEPGDPGSGCFMGRIRLTSTGGPILAPAAAPGQDPLVAAVLPFAARDEDQQAGLGRAAARFLENRLAGSAGLKLIERSRIDAIVGELEFQQGGMVDQSTAVATGRLLGARLIITGDLDRTGADLVVSARIIDVETGEILCTTQVHCGQCGAEDIITAIDLLAGELVGD